VFDDARELGPDLSSAGERLSAERAVVDVSDILLEVTDHDVEVPALKRAEHPKDDFSTWGRHVGGLPESAQC
jgi:hypothetical protein